MIGIRKSAAIGLVLLVSGCKVGPNYKRPVVSTPDQYRGVAPDLSAQPGATPFAEMQWETVFQDETLRALIKEALTNNYDMQIAASRIVQDQGRCRGGAGESATEPQCLGRRRLSTQRPRIEWADRGFARHPVELHRRFLGEISTGN